MNDFLAALAPPVALPAPVPPDLHGPALTVALVLATALLVHALLGQALQRAWRRLRLHQALRRWRQHPPDDSALHVQALVELARRHQLAPGIGWQLEADALRFQRPGTDADTRSHALARRLAGMPFVAGRQ